MLTGDEELLQDCAVVEHGRLRGAGRQRRLVRVRAVGQQVRGGVLQQAHGDGVAQARRRRRQLRGGRRERVCRALHDDGGDAVGAGARCRLARRCENARDRAHDVRAHARHLRDRRHERLAALCRRLRRAVRLLAANRRGKRCKCSTIQYIYHSTNNYKQTFLALFIIFFLTVGIWALTLGHFFQALDRALQMA